MSFVDFTLAAAPWVVCWGVVATIVGVYSVAGGQDLYRSFVISITWPASVPVLFVKAILKDVPQTPGQSKVTLSGTLPAGITVDRTSGKIVR